MREKPSPPLEELFGRQDLEAATKLAEWARYFIHPDFYDDWHEEEAERFYLNALEIINKVQASEHIDTANCFCGLGNLYSHQGLTEKAQLMYAQELEIVEKVLGPEHPRVAECLHWMGIRYLEEGQIEPAEPLLRRAIAIREQVSGPTHSDTMESLMVYAHVLFELGRKDEAEDINRFVNAEWKGGQEEWKLERARLEQEGWYGKDMYLEDPFAGE